MKIVSFSLEAGNNYFAKIDGQRFFVGQRITYEGLKGLVNLRGTATQRYSADIYRNAYGYWADFIYPTSVCEGGLFHTLNTYDRARFTFTAFQLAAHVPDGDFVVYFRKLLGLPLATEYFPDVRVIGNRIHRVDGSTKTQLEDSSTTAGLLDYLNPTSAEVEDTEVIQSARFIHWTLNDPAHRDLQVSVVVEHFKNNLADYAKQYGLDGKSDVICLIVADIRHQGRAKSSSIQLALSASDPEAALLDLGMPKYKERIATLKREIRRQREAGTLGKLKYKLSKKDFVPL